MFSLNINQIESIWQSHADIRVCMLMKYKTRNSKNRKKQIERNRKNSKKSFNKYIKIVVKYLLKIFNEDSKFKAFLNVVDDGGGRDGKIIRLLYTHMSDNRSQNVW